MTQHGDTGDGLPPLILTARLDPASQARFERERRHWFPASRNQVPAHVTLFHALPGDLLDAIAGTLRQEAGIEPPPFSATRLRFLGRGTAYVLDMPAVAALRARLAAGWADRLTRQDAQPWVAHLTVQNKLGAAEAKAAFATLQAGFTPQDGEVVGLDLWHYLGGPWEKAGFFPFVAHA